MGCSLKKNEKLLDKWIERKVSEKSFIFCKVSLDKKKLLMLIQTQEIYSDGREAAEWASPNFDDSMVGAIGCSLQPVE